MSGPIRFEVRHSFEAADEGTRLQLTAEGEAGGMLRFAGPMVARQAERQFRADLERLKHVLDRDAFEPFRTGVEIIKHVKARCAAFEWKGPPYEYEFEKLPIEVLIGGPVASLFPD